ncbi:MAG: PAS domain-containing protein [Thioploca sp.]|nr:PAS domain-containing protein [Thioploca sp.]
MTLRKKTLLIIGSALVGLLLLLLMVSSTILLKEFIAFENSSIKKNVNSAINILANELTELGIIATSHAIGDDIYAYMVNNDEAYIVSHYTPAIFETLNLNVLILLNLKGEIQFSRAYNTAQHELESISPNLQAHFGEQSLFRYHPDTNNQMTGLLLLQKQVLLVASRPILTSLKQGPSRGTLIMGRFLNALEIQKLNNLTQLTINIQPLHHQTFSTTVTPVTEVKSQPPLVQIMNDNRIAGYTLLKDIYQQPAALLRIEMPREIYQHGLTSLWYLCGIVLIFAVILSGLILWLFERLVLARLALLSHEVMQIDTTGNLSTVTVIGQDELSRLAMAINNMLEQADIYHERLRRSEASLAEAQRIAHLGNWDWDIIHNTFYCSDEIYRIFGLRPRSVEPDYELFLTAVHPDDRNLVSSHINKAMSEDKLYSIEHRIMQRNGTIRYIHTRGEKIKDDTGQVIHIIGTVQDITERHLIQQQTLQLLEENRFLVHRTLAIREEEHRKLARELHDEFGQCITAIQADAATIANLAQDDQSRCSAKIIFSTEAIMAVSTRVYNVVHSRMQELHPSSLDQLGLVDALRELITIWQARHPQTICNFEAEGNLDHPALHKHEVIMISVYRIVQECLTNVRKYAQALQVTIILNADVVTQQLIVGIQDDGQGINLERRKRGLGLIGMRERVQAIDGQWLLESAPGQGVKIVFTIPITEENLYKHARWERRDEEIAKKLLEKYEKLT